ncbi:hypothetical protein F5X68DRAFT_245578 [Plectosphaerella plurivora]|uniref:N-acetyltransferase domain-containing protein n=1 Tax=Plectosphaerella plurivora TaxID=936078 RepID=A0A9P9A5S3_9PEZI|nr:hypothetical protein F5X68DRAFT_245578 [Plectosphaerella plurivora]
MTDQPTPTTAGVSCFTIPRTLASPKDFDTLVEKYKSFRLLSLQLSPESFGSTYAREAAFTPEAWTSRITNLLATTIVAVSDPPEPARTKEAEPLLSHEWLASLTLIGPLEPSKAHTMFQTELPTDSKVVDFNGSGDGGMKWHYILNAMYVVPLARGRGISGEILKFAKKTAKREVRGNPMRILLVVDHDNEAAQHTYKRAGFEEVHRYTIDAVRVGRDSKTKAVVMRWDLEAPRLNTLP